jgi:hypothetical protein
MACGCSKGNSISASGSAESVYIFTDPNTGKQTTYRSMYEAKYAQAMAGGGGNIRAEAKG